MIPAGIFYYAICDECGERIQLYDEGGYMVGESVQEVRDFITDSGGLCSEDGVVTCHACREEKARAARRKGSREDS